MPAREEKMRERELWSVHNARERRKNERTVTIERS